jgi:hypothetical protein
MFVGKLVGWIGGFWSSRVLTVSQSVSIHLPLVI